MATIPASENVFPVVRLAEVAAPATPPAGEAHLYVKSDGLLYWKDDAGNEWPAGGDISAHTGDTTDAHDASAISVADAGGLYTGTDVEAALAEIGAHPGDTSAAHAASAVSIADAGAYFTGTDVEAALQELGAAAGGGGGGLALPTVVQTAIGSHGSGSPTITIAQPATDSLIVVIACFNGTAPTWSLTNYTMTQLFTDNVAGIGNLQVVTGVYDGSGTPGTSLSPSGGGGTSGAMMIELAATTLVGNGSGTLRAQTMDTSEMTAKMKAQEAGNLIGLLVHTGGAASQQAPGLRGVIEVGQPHAAAAQPLMFGFAVSPSIPIMGWYNGAASQTYTLVDVRIAF